MQSSARALLVGLLASYGSYHRDPRNRLSHFFGVPLIIFALLIALALSPAPIFGVRLHPDRLVAAALAAFYLLLDLRLGIALTASLLILVAAAEATARLGRALAAELAVCLFSAGWLLQLLGHRLEGNKPALLDNIRQIFVAPIYLAAELAFALGLRRSLQAEIDQRLEAAPPHHI
jgi:uncharacterized membrane protein YGL010W